MGSLLLHESSWVNHLAFRPLHIKSIWRQLRLASDKALPSIRRSLETIWMTWIRRFRILGSWAYLASLGDLVDDTELRDIEWCRNKHFQGTILNSLYWTIGLPILIVSISIASINLIHFVPDLDENPLGLVSWGWLKFYVFQLLWKGSADWHWRPVEHFRNFCFWRHLKLFFNSVQVKLIKPIFILKALFRLFWLVLQTLVLRVFRRKCLVPGADWWQEFFNRLVWRLLRYQVWRHTWQRQALFMYQHVVFWISVLRFYIYYAVLAV